MEPIESFSIVTGKHLMSLRFVDHDNDIDFRMHIGNNDCQNQSSREHVLMQLVGLLGLNPHFNPMLCGAWALHFHYIDVNCHAKGCLIHHYEAELLQHCGEKLVPSIRYTPAQLKTIPKETAAFYVAVC
ncbi:hypothetical protein RJ640_026548 [Escallonia rubra]|uniref:Uncharacterized protein n=1 Tax=Escallonia rubra TaxID=112253 RepID=A0AA88U9Q5_9ASTE|nr:hypothetical protein RJ640_026548 [Escallonia rubra]